MIKNNKIKIKDLCSLLRSNPRKKIAFFKLIKDPKYLIPLFKEKMFSLNDESSYYFCCYLLELTKNHPTSKDDVISVIEDCLKKCDVKKISFSSYVKLTEVLDSLDCDSFFYLNIKKLLFSDYSIHLIIIVLKKLLNFSNKKKSQIILRYVCYSLFKIKDSNKRTKGLHPDLFSHDRSNLFSILNPINKLICEEKKEGNGSCLCQFLGRDPFSFDSILVSDMDKLMFDLITYFKRIFLNKKNSNVFFFFMKKKYYKGYKYLYQGLNLQSEFLERQSIDIESMLNDLYDSKKSSYLDIIVFFLIIFLSYYPKNFDLYIKSLLADEHYYLRKIGLYVVAENISKCGSNFNKYLAFFLDSISPDNTSLVVKFCAYEIIHLFDLYSRNYNSGVYLTDSLGKKNNKIDNKIHSLLNNLSEDTLKFRLLHGLKEHPGFKSEFAVLSQKYGYELSDPGIFFKQLLLIP